LEHQHRLHADLIGPPLLGKIVATLLLPFRIVACTIHCQFFQVSPTYAFFPRKNRHETDTIRQSLEENDKVGKKN
jgi:hypothetical protein